MPFKLADTVTAVLETAHNSGTANADQPEDEDAMVTAVLETAHNSGQMKGGQSYADFIVTAVLETAHNSGSKFSKSSPVLQRG